MPCLVSSHYHLLEQASKAHVHLRQNFRSLSVLRPPGSASRQTHSPALYWLQKHPLVHGLGSIRGRPHCLFRMPKKCYSIGGPSWVSWTIYKDFHVAGGIAINRAPGASVDKCILPKLAGSSQCLKGEFNVAVVPWGIRVGPGSLSYCRPDLGFTDVVCRLVVSVSNLPQSR
jgi:hypothetical protein